MKNTLLIILFLLTQNMYAQQLNKQGNLQGLKIAYMTRELNLSSQEAQQFWPLYYSFVDERKVIHNEMKNDAIGLDEKNLELKKKYFQEFKKVLGNEDRVNKCFLCERDFGNYIRKEIQARQKLKQQNKQ